MNESLKGRVALVTGGSAGIGLASARELSARGARVFVTGRPQAELDAPGAPIGNANAGGGDMLRLGSITEEHFDRIFGTNVKGVLFTVQKALPLLRDGGSVIL